MSIFFDKFPLTRYDINKDTFARHEQSVTNILFRISVIKSVLDNISTYYEYDISNGETPEILADKFYDNPELHWVILYANDRFDPFYDWPMDYNTFKSYIADKYRAIAGGDSLSDNQVIAWSQDETPSSNSIHHYDKIVERTESKTGTITTEIFEVNKANLTIDMASSIDVLPYDTYDTLPDEGAYISINFGNTTTTQRTYRRAVSYFTYEDELNESKRKIKIIKREYMPLILEELSELTGQNSRSGFRRLA
jgi:hypothetical protein